MNPFDPPGPPRPVERPSHAAMSVDWPSGPSRLREALNPVGLATTLPWVMFAGFLVYSQPDRGVALRILAGFTPLVLTAGARILLVLTRTRSSPTAWLLADCSRWSPLDLHVFNALLMAESGLVLTTLGVLLVYGGGPWLGTLGWLSMLVMGGWGAHLYLYYALISTVSLYDVPALRKLADLQFLPPMRRHAHAMLALFDGDARAYTRLAGLPAEQARRTLAEVDDDLPDDAVGKPWPRDGAGLVYHVDWLIHRPLLAGDPAEALARWQVLEPDLWRLGTARDAVALSAVAALCALGRIDEAHRLARTMRNDLVSAPWMEGVAPKTWALTAPLRAP